MFSVLLIAAQGAQAQAPRGMGLIKEPEEVYRAFASVPRYRNWIPPEADLSARFPPAGHQGEQGSCTAWAVGYAVRSYYEGRQQDWTFNSPSQLISPAYLYNTLTQFSGDCNQGTSISSALELLKNGGAPTLDVFPYSADHCSLRPNPAALARAKLFRINGWRRLDAHALDDAKGQIHRGNPVIFGMDISASFHRLRRDEVYDDTASPREGGHAMVMVGYSESRQAFKVLNSWGTDWAGDGYGWVSYNAVRRLADRLFVVEMPDPPPKPMVVVPPPPSPETPKPVVAVTPEPQPEPPKPVVVVPPPPPPEPPKPIVVVKPEPPKPVVVLPPPPEPPKPIVVVTPPPAPPKPVVVVPPAQVIPPVSFVQQQVAARARELSCSRVESSVSPERAVRLRGFAGSVDELARLQTALRVMPGVASVDTDVRIYPWPQCEVFLNFADALSVRGGVAAALRGGAMFRDGDSLAIDVVTPDYPSHVYVSYLQANGEVVHLNWPQGRFPKPLPPNTRVTLGGGANGQPVYRIGRPFGDEIVVVITSASPLFTDALGDNITEREYLTAFRRAFMVRPQGGAGERVYSAVALPLKTQPKP